MVQVNIPYNITPDFILKDGGILFYKLQHVFFDRNFGSPPRLFSVNMLNELLILHMDLMRFQG